MVDKKEIYKVSEYISNMKIIMFCPDDLDIIKGSPQIRRNLMNIQLSQLFISYYRNPYSIVLLQQSYAFMKVLSFLAQIQRRLVSNKDLVTAISQTHRCSISLVAIAHLDSMEISSDH